jgi:hypothetical protein
MMAAVAGRGLLGLLFLMALAWQAELAISAFAGVGAPRGCLH